MKRYFLLLATITSCTFINVVASEPLTRSSLPSDIHIYNDIAIHYPAAETIAAWQSLQPAERVCAYYIFRAALAGNQIYVDQIHRHGSLIQALLGALYQHKDTLAYADADFTEQFFEQLKSYLVFLWAHQGLYDQDGYKRTPASFDLTLITAERIARGLKALGDTAAHEHVAFIYRSLFDASFEPMLTTPGVIEQSAINFYDIDFTEADYQALPEQIRALPTAYFGITFERFTRKALVERYRITEKYSTQLTVMLYWLARAEQHAQQHPQFFDNFFVHGLNQLIAHIVTGDQEYQQQHIAQWAQSTSRLQCICGFYDTSKDPKQTRALFQAAIAIRSAEHAPLMRWLKGLDTNKNLYAQIFSIGSLGPIDREHAMVPYSKNNRGFYSRRACSATLSPFFQPVYEQQQLVDIELLWPEDVMHLQWYWSKIALTTN